MPPSASPLSLALECARAAAGCRSTQPADADLLARFAHDRDGDAFADLVRRHGPLVLGVARRRLADRQAAEDVLQGTFLALARQAGRLRPDTVLAGWLHTVAFRLARKAQVQAARRDQVVVQASRLRFAGGTPAPQQDPLAALTARELVAALDAELARLPERYRLPLVLCALEGLSRDEAAVRLGWTIGAFRGRLERGRELLRTRLAARGLTVPAVLAGGLLVTPAEAMPAALVRAVVRAAVVVPPAAVPVKLLMVAAVVLTMLGVGTGTALLSGGQPGPKANPPVPMAVGPVVPQPRVDVEGVPLPPGVLARLGSSRMRHAGGVHTVTFAPDGRSLLSAAPDGVRLCDTATGRQVRNFAGKVRSQGLRYGPDGREVLAFRVDKPGSFERWDVATGRELLRAQMPDQPSGAIAFSRDGRRFAVGWSDRTTRLYETAKGKEILRITHEGTAYGLDFAPDGKLIAVADGRDTVVLHDTVTGQAAGELKREGAHYSFVALAPDGRTLAALSAEGRGLITDIDFWDVPARKHLRRISGPDVFSADHLTFSPDGTLLAQCSQNPDVILWETASGREARRFRCFPSTNASAFSPDGRILAVTSNSGTITLWGVATGKLLQPSADPIVGVGFLRFTDKGRQLIGMADGFVAWDVATAKEVRRYPFPPPVSGPCWLSPDERLIASLRGRDAAEPAVDLWDAPTGKLVRSLRGTKQFWPTVTFTPDSRRVIASDMDKVIHIRDVASGDELGALAGHPSWVRGLEVSPDGRRLASVSNDGHAGDFTVRLWDLQTYREIRQLTPGHETVFAMKFSPDGRRLVTVGGNDPGRPQDRGEVRLWDVESGRELRTFGGEMASMICVAYSPDGRTLATAGYDNTLRLWEVATGTERHRFTGHAGYVFSVAFSPDGRMLAASSPDAPVFLWDVYGRSEPASAFDLDQCWADLASMDATTAFRSVRRLIPAPAAATFLRHRLKPAAAADATQVNEWIEKLDSPKFADRQAAAKELEAVADRAADQLRATLAETKSAEARQALQTILDRLDAATPEMLRALRSVEVLEQIGNPAAREHLKTLAGGATGATLTRAAADAMRRGGK